TPQSHSPVCRWHFQKGQSRQKGGPVGGAGRDGRHGPGERRPGDFCYKTIVKSTLMKTSNSSYLSRIIMVIPAVLSLCVRAEDLKHKAEEAVNNFKLADPGLTNFFNKSAGYIILPKVGEAGFIFGGERGDGLVYQDKKLVGKVLMKEYSVGAQIGDASFAEVI